MIRRNYAYAIERVYSLILNFIFIIYLGQKLDKSQFGEFTYLSSLALVLWSSMLVAADPILQAEDRKGTWWGYIIVSLYTTVFLYLLIILSLVYVDELNSLRIIPGNLIVYLALLILPAPLLLIESVMRSRGNKRGIIFARVFSFSSGAAVKFSVLSFSPSVSNLLLATAAEMFLFSLILWLIFILCYSRKSASRGELSVPEFSSGRVKFETVREIARDLSFAVFGAGLVLLQQRVSIFLLAKSAGYGAVAELSLAQQIASIASTLFSVVLSGGLGELAAARKDSSIFREKITRLYRFASASGWLLCIATSASYFILEWVGFAGKYSNIGNIILLQSLTIPLALMGSVRAVIINVDNKQGCHAVSAIVGILVTVIPAILLGEYFTGLEASILGVAGFLASAFATSWLFSVTKSTARLQFSLLVAPFLKAV